MAKEIAKLYDVKVVPKDLKAIPDVLPYKQFIQGDEKKVKLTKSEIMRCMNFGDVYLNGEDDPINTATFKDLEDFEEQPAEETEDEENIAKSSIPAQIPSPVKPEKLQQPLDSQRPVQTHKEVKSSEVKDPVDPKDGKKEEVK